MVIGYIYKIYDNTNGNVYYGSTKETISRRICGHRAAYKRWIGGNGWGCKSYDILKNEDYAYSLVETVEYENKMELHQRERFWIENNECLNKTIPSRTNKEYKEANKDKKKEYNKEYYEKNKDDIKEKNKEYDKQYREANKDKIKQYRETNKDAINEKKKEYREANRVLINEKNKLHMRAKRAKQKEEEKIMSTNII